jgi:hypothetical protein
MDVSALFVMSREATSKTLTNNLAQHKELAQKILINKLEGFPATNPV